MKKHFISPIIAAGLFAYAGCVYAAPTTIAAQGKSTFSIVLPANAPASVQAAAKELQQDIAASTGATLPVVQDISNPAQYIISLGQTRQATAAGINSTGVAEEGFRIVTQNDNIYILGPDTANGKLTNEGGTSNGTANGVYTFLEDYLGVRWLMPGALGLDVPTKNVFTVDSINRTEAPVFINRREPYIQNELPAVEKWQDHQKLGYSFRIEHSHNWTQTVTPDLYKDHPDWFPMIDGKRIPPSGRYKLETTNPDLVNFFAQKAVDALKANPQINTFSLSPSDSRGWSQSPESEALYDPPPPGEKFPSVTPLILKFYRDVAQIVAKEDPQGKLAGYIYADYLYPPTKGGMTLPDNFYPVIAPSIDYGFTLYRPNVQHDFNDLMQEWSKVTPHLFYYDLPNTITSASGMITPPGTEILNFIFPRLANNNVKGVYFYGTDAWGQTALANYLIAKMEWNPQLDANQLQHEWLMRAYGPQAGAAMETLYQKLDGWFRDYYQQHTDAHYVLTDAMLQGIYGVHEAELEQLFLNAKSQTMTPLQQQRLQLVEDNLIALQWRLRNAKDIPADYHSDLTRSDDEVMQMLQQKNQDFELFPGMIDSGPNVKPVKVQLGSPVSASPREVSAHLRGENLLLLYSANGGPVTVTPIAASGGKPFISYALKDAKNALLQTGVFAKGKPVTFTAQAKMPYFFYINSGIYSFSVQGAAAALQTNMDEGRLHLFASPSTLYFHVPAGITQWNFMLSSEAPGETAKVTISSPDGQQAAVLETGAQPAQNTTLNGQNGFWKIDVSKASTGILDDIYLNFDKSLPAWVSLDPSQPLEVSPEK